MTRLRITQTTESTGNHCVELSLDGNGLVPQRATATFAFGISPHDQEDLRWYLEDYLQFPHDPAPTIAVRIEQRMTQIGAALFKAVFESSMQATRLWAKVHERASDLRVEIVTGVREASAIPWELLRDPHTDMVLALNAASFVRTHHDSAVTPKWFNVASSPIRILLVICRPQKGDDVPFRSVASRLVKSLTADARAAFQLDVLRPPTYDQLARTLRQANRDGLPYHVVHFDGHGMYTELSVDDGGEAASSYLAGLIPLMLSGPREGSHGYLLFENPANEQNLQLVGGDTLGKLLYETNTPALVLNACRSAHADVAEQPKHAKTSDEMHKQVRALGSLAQEVIDAGVMGVVAMRYNVYVVTAAQFVADLYAALLQGNTLGEAVTLGRKQLRDNTDRTIAFAPRPIQDWCVPLVFEAMPTVLFKPNDKTEPLSIKVGVAESSAAAGSLDRKLPVAPDFGFFGRDETLLALDRAFDTQPIVLLHAYAGSGKTATAAEFARWYSLTGGVAGPVMFTSFEQNQPLARVLDRVGEIFGPILEQSDVNWLALDDDARRDVTLQLMRQIPVLWIWDNVEPVTGFPAGTKSAWSDNEQRELVDFLRDGAQTKAKFLLTSRRDEREWLGDNLPCRIAVPPMHMQERVQLAQAIAQRQQRTLTDVDGWRTLLRFTAGNPLTITVVVRQAIRDGLKTRDEIEAFVEKLRSGEGSFDDDTSDGRDQSLAASLSYGFEHAFNQDELKKVAVLCVFHETVEAALICEMGNPEKPHCLDELKGIQREEVSDLLVRAAEIGLISRVENVVDRSQHDHFFLHPAVPWFLKKLAARFGTDANLQTTRAFVEAMAWCAKSMVQWCTTGHPMALDTLAHYEANSRRAFDVALSQEWVEPLEGIVRGLFYLYADTGRWPELNGFVISLIPHVCDDKGELPRPGWELVWTAMTEYRAIVTAKSGDVHRAERYQLQRVSLARQSARTALTKTDPCADIDDENQIRVLASAILTLGNVQREIDIQQSKIAYTEAIELAVRIKDPNLEGRGWLCLGIMQLAVSDEIDEAEASLLQALALFPPQSHLDRSKALYELGKLSHMRYLKAFQEGKHVKQLGEHLEAARRYFESAISQTPQFASDSLALRHGGLADVYSSLGKLEAAVEHGKLAIRYDEVCGNPLRGAIHRLGVAHSLAKMRNFAGALDFARAARGGFQAIGQRNMLDEIDQFILELKPELDASKDGLYFGGQYRIGINEIVVPRKQIIEAVKRFDKKQHFRHGEEVSEQHAMCSAFAKAFGDEGQHRYTLLVLTFDLLYEREVGAAFRIYGVDVPHTSDDSPLELLKSFLEVYGVDIALKGAGTYRLVQNMDFTAPDWVRDETGMNDAIISSLELRPRDDQPGWIDVGLMKQHALADRKSRIELAFAVHRRGYGLDLRAHEVNVPLALIPECQG